MDPDHKPKQASFLCSSTTQLYGVPGNREWAEMVWGAGREADGHGYL